MRILVVEDELELAETIAEGLRLVDTVWICAETGQRLLKPPYWGVMILFCWI